MAKIPSAYRIDEDVKNALPSIATKYDRSQNWIVNHALKLFIQSENKKKTVKSN